MANRDQDKLIWQAYTKNLKPVVPQRASSSIKQDRPKKRIHITEAPTLDLLASCVDVKPPAPITLERKREKALRQGNVEIEAKLDLHGMTQREAHEALARFMQRCVKNGKRQLLIITGKGAQGQGVLRRNLEGWLRQLPEHISILTIRKAAFKHGGDGACYVLLRKK